MAEFDQYSENYDAELKRSLAGIGSIDLAVRSKLDLLERVLGDAGLKNAPRILDFGCGTGLLSQHLGHFAQQVIGLDVSGASLTHSSAPHSQRVAYDGAGIPVRDDSVDVIVASCVFHHIEPAQRDRSLQEIHRVLVPGGIFVMIEHNPWNPVTRWVVNRCEFDEDAVLLSHTEARNLLVSAGFTQVDGRYIFTVPPLNGAFSALDSAFGSLPMGAQFYVHGRKEALAGGAIRFSSPEATAAAPASALPNA